MNLGLVGSGNLDAVSEKFEELQINMKVIWHVYTRPNRSKSKANR